MDKKVIILIILVVVIVCGGLYLAGFYFGPKAFQYQQKNSIAEATPTITAPATISPENNFSKSGNLVNKEEILNLLYDEPGKLASFVVLKFTPESICDLGEVDTTCDLSKLEDGLFVAVTGQQNNNEVEVYKLQEQEAY